MNKNVKINVRIVKKMTIQMKMVSNNIVSKMHLITKLKKNLIIILSNNLTIMMKTVHICMLTSQGEQKAILNDHQKLLKTKLVKPNLLPFLLQSSIHLTINLPM